MLVPVLTARTQRSPMMRESLDGYIIGVLSVSFFTLPQIEPKSLDQQ
jgi:hypothetical protein